MLEEARHVARGDGQVEAVDGCRVDAHARLARVGLGGVDVEVGGLLALRRNCESPHWLGSFLRARPRGPRGEGARLRKRCTFASLVRKILRAGPPERRPATVP